MGGQSWALELSQGQIMDPLMGSQGESVLHQKFKSLLDTEEGRALAASPHSLPNLQAGPWRLVPTNQAPPPPQDGAVSTQWVPIGCRLCQPHCH